jgi:uncharacterized protein
MNKAKPQAAGRCLLIDACGLIGLWTLGFGIFLVCACRPSVTPAERRFPLPVTQLIISDHTADVELARLPHERNRGLMFRKTLAPDSGMLFVFDTPEPQRFWMKNTLIPLSIAFADTSGIITDILEMAALDTTTDYSPHLPVIYALEMNKGWFAAHSIKPGDTISGLPGR